MQRYVEIESKLHLFTTINTAKLLVPAENARSIKKTAKMYESVRYLKYESGDRFLTILYLRNGSLMFEIYNYWLLS